MVTTMSSAKLYTPKTTLSSWASTVIVAAPGPVMVTSSEMWSWPTSWIVPVRLASKLIVSVWAGSRLDWAMASRSVVSPSTAVTSLRVLTVIVAAWAGAAPAS